MASGSSEDRCRSSHRSLADLYGDEPEEGEFVPAWYHSDADTEEYYSHRDCSSDSDQTISDSVPANHGGASTSSAAANYGSGGAYSAAANNKGGGGASSAAAPVLACPFCGKVFRNHKAVCGHMKVHREQGTGKDKGIKRKRGTGKCKGFKRNAPVVGSWGGAAKRGCTGSRGKAASPDAESDQSMAVVVAEAEIVLEPMPLAFATPSLPSVPMATATTNLPSVPMASETSNPSTAPTPTASATPNPSPMLAASAIMASESVESSSAQPMHNDARETVVEGAANPPTEAVVHLHLHAAPPPPAAGEQAPPPVHQQPDAPPPGGRQDPYGYTCKKCNMWFRTHQGLGGHMVGHKNRELAAALQGGAVPNHRNAKPEKTHVCKVCGAEFPEGLQLGGHMRKHWKGAPFNTKPRRLVIPPLTPPPGTATVGVADLTLALSVKADEASPAPRPAVAGRVLLFGFDIAAGMKTPPAQEGSPATEASASTGGEQ